MLRDTSNEHLKTQASVETLRMLAMGKHPETGSELPADNCYHAPRVLRALFTAISALEKGPRNRNLPPRAGQTWSMEESTQLEKEFAERHLISELAAMYQRTTGAITSKLAKLGLISPLINANGVAGTSKTSSL